MRNRKTNIKTPYVSFSFSQAQLHSYTPGPLAPPGRAGGPGCGVTVRCSHFPLLPSTPVQSPLCCRKHLLQHLEHLLWLWCSLCQLSLFLFSLSSSVIFLPFLYTFSQTYCQLCWWAQLWPVVSWAVSGTVQALTSSRRPCIPPTTKTLPWTPSMRKYERFYAVLLGIKKT